MLIANTVLFVDDADDDVFAKNIDALAILLREAGATYEDAANSFIATIDESHATGVSQSNERATLLSPEFVLETHLMVFIARDDLSAARRLASIMEECSWLSSKAKTDAWGRILSHLRQVGMLLLDGNHASPGYERKFHDLTVLVMSMGQPLGIDILCNFFHDFAAEVSKSDSATEQEKAYVTVAAQRTLLLLLRNRYSNDEKAIKEWSKVFPSLSYFGSNAVEWAEGFVQRKNPVPESLLVNGFIDLNAFRNRSILAHRHSYVGDMAVDGNLQEHLNHASLAHGHAHVEALAVDRDLQEHRQRMRADEEVCAVDDSDEPDVDVIDIANDEIEEIEVVDSERDEDETEEDETLDTGEDFFRGAREDDSHEEKTDVVETREAHGHGRLETDYDYNLQVYGDRGVFENGVEVVEIRELGGHIRQEEDYGLDGETSPEESDGGSDMRDSVGPVEEDESAGDEHDVVEILDDSDDEEMLEESESFLERELESDDEAQEADFERHDDDVDVPDGDDTGSDEQISTGSKPASGGADLDEMNDTDHDEGLDLKQRNDEACVDQGYEPDSAGGDTSQAEVQSRVENGYEPDSSSQIDEQDAFNKVMWHEGAVTAAHLEKGYEPDTAEGDISHAEMQDRLEKGYEPDAGSQVDDQEERELEEVQRAKERREAQARLEQGYEPDTAGGDISQAEIQDRLEQGYEPDTAAVYTEEEVSEAAQSEDDDNGLDEPSQDDVNEGGAVPESQKPHHDQSGTLSDDMDAADDRTEVDHAAELSEVEESMSQAFEAAENGTLSIREAGSTLVAFAHQAQLRPADENEELATDLQRNTANESYSPSDRRMSAVNRSLEPDCTRTTADSDLGETVACGSTPGTDLTHVQSALTDHDYTDATHEPLNDEAPETHFSTHVDPPDKGLFGYHQGGQHLRPAPPKRSLSTIVHLSASEMSDDAVEDELDKIQEENISGSGGEPEIDDDYKQAGILSDAEPAPEFFAVAGEEGGYPESVIDVKTPGIQPNVEPPSNSAVDAVQEPENEVDAPDVLHSAKPSQTDVDMVEEGDARENEVTFESQPPKILPPANAFSEYSVEECEESEDHEHEMDAKPPEIQTPDDPSPKCTGEKADEGQESDIEVDSDTCDRQQSTEPSKHAFETSAEEAEPENKGSEKQLHIQVEPAPAGMGEEGDEPDSEVNAEIQDVHSHGALIRKGRSRTKPQRTDSGVQGKEPENEGDAMSSDIPSNVAQGRKRRGAILASSTECGEEGDESLNATNVDPDETNPAEAQGRKKRSRIQLKPNDDFVTAEALEISKRETRTTVKAVVKVTRTTVKAVVKVEPQDKPKKRGRQPVKDEESRVATRKRVRGETSKDKDVPESESEIDKEETESVVDESKRPGGKNSTKKSAEDARMRRSARARISDMEEEVHDGEPNTKVAGTRSRVRPGKENKESQEEKPRKRGQQLVGEVDPVPEISPPKTRSRGRPPKAPSVPDAENQPHSRTTRRSGKKADNESPATTTQSAVAGEVEDDAVDEGLKAGTQPRKTRGAKRETGTAMPVSATRSRTAGAQGALSRRRTKEEEEVQPPKARSTKKKSDVAPIEDTIVPTRRSARERKPKVNS